MTLLPPDYISGFVDGEGCFSLNFRRDVRHEIQGSPQYFMWRASFAIVLRIDDIELLQAIRSTLACGTVSVTGEQARFHVQDLKTMAEVIIPFFDKYPLRGKKKHDFKLWREAVDVLYRHRQSSIGKKKGVVRWAASDLQHLLEIHDRMKAFKSRGTRSKHVSVAQDKNWVDAVAQGAPSRLRTLDL